MVLVGLFGLVFVCLGEFVGFDLWGFFCLFIWFDFAFFCLWFWWGCLVWFLFVWGSLLVLICGVFFVYSFGLILLSFVFGTLRQGLSM